MQQTSMSMRNLLLLLLLLLPCENDRKLDVSRTVSYK